ncbi:hypothetical protein [Streptomyces sp. NPDC051776]|uniref:hypothetical protein n=1 Tax=Streptomyces sp. NPDC051776 TaxID=3155414 RepID=UPI0034209AA3
MDYTKLDASLALAVDDASGDPDVRRLAVIVRLAAPASGPQAERLRSAGIDTREAGERTVLTGVLSVSDVESLSGQPWVVSLSLSARRHPL